MDILSSGGNRTPSSSRRTQERRVEDSPDVEQDADSDEDAVVVTARRMPRAKERASSSRVNGVVDENDENEDPADSATPATSNSVHGKRRRLSESGRAAAVATPTQNTHQDDDEVDDDEDDDTLPPPDASGSGSGLRGPFAEDEDDEDEEVDPLNAEAAEEAKERKKPLMKKQLLVRDKTDGYVMGSIVRIKCHNFLTYFDIECYPGPHLNMIFGPNGAGKSSLVAAIALGLGFPPKLMARSKKLQEFVKRGTTEGYVEIELKGRPGKTNLTVRRSFSAKNDRSEFRVNGNPATKSDVANYVRRLHVNVNNLCSFLPQDRVADFAKMTGEELLRETQRTADEELLLFQEKLTELKNKLSTADRDLAKHKNELVDQERKMMGLERDVRKHKERQAIEDRLIVEEACLPYVQYNEAKSAHADAKRERNELKGRVDEMADDNAPLMEQKDALKAHIKEADARRKALSKKRDEIMRAHHKAMESVAEIEGKVLDLREELKQVREAEEKRKRKIEDSQRKIRDLKKEREGGPPKEASLEVGERSRELREQASNLKAQIHELAAQHDDLRKNIDSTNDERTRVQQQLQALGNVQRQREELCRAEDVALWTAFDYVRRNRNSFKSKVYDPVRLSVSVKDKRHARVAEAAINYAAMKTIVCLEKDDYTSLGDTFTKFKTSDHPDAQTKDLRVNVAELPADMRDPAQYERPCTQQQLESLGFDAFVIDLLEGPPDVLAYLCYSSNLHRIPVAFGDGRNVAHERLRQPNSPFRRYITHNNITDIQFSKYGNRGAVVQDMQTRDARLFAESIDQNRVREFELKLAEADAAKADAQRQRDELALKDTEVRTQLEAIVEEKAQLDREKIRIDKAKIHYERLGVDLRNAQASLESLQQQPNADAKRKMLADKMKKLSLKRVKTSRSLEGYSAALIRCHALEAHPMLAQLQSSASLQALETTIATRSDEQAGVLKEYERVNKLVNDLRAVAKRIFQQAEEEQTKVPERLSETFQERVNDLQNEGTSADDVNQSVQDLKGELELSQNVSSSVIERYEALKASVEKLQRNIEREENGVRGDKEEIKNIHAKWYPRVTNIVETVGGKFSSAMQSLGCLGEVAIREDEEDYAKWAISIKVAFRDGESLAELTSHRQSGGERSLTTMMYLISLLEMSKVPFSLVDEINQGMDPRAERAVHNHLVRAVCEAPDVGQYFLLTPKLLTNLYYHSNIKILCVANGYWLPEDGLPLRKFIDMQVAAKRRSIRV